ncbi:hypothetical protein SK069_01450 [Patulibacter brassicae]|jgi:hypothetical protein|uniref:Cellulase family glycosylhydrolase n=1 Tax=Patulibacter brassicae TaxID=1705717 RepID=A0ABU4VEQ7_9ACTN|nr:hypothetical protein [Patulibacter brassicae]MDX8150247.1 hypothetical protein [Patulibacter brassicae]
MTSRLRRATPLVLAAAGLLALPGGASASKTMLTGIADENVLNGATPGGADTTVAKWKAEGIQDVRTFAQWNKLAPDVDATKVPEGKDWRDPASYDFSSLDRKIDLVRRHGLGVTLVLTGPGPVWGSLEPARRNGTLKPNPTLFGQFSEAVAKHVADRVDRYIIWNEPNVATWLQPQWTCTGLKCRPYSPYLYRQLAAKGYAAVKRHDSTARVAIGGTSSKGTIAAPRIGRTNSAMQPLVFLREMSCVTAKYKRTRSGRCKGFKPLSGEALSYHPHPREFSPGRTDPAKDNARIADLPRLLRALDRMQRAGGFKVRGAKRMPLWLDEFGYETYPPDRKGNGTVSLSRQKAWTQWGIAKAARQSRVQMLTQYEWFDEPTGSDENEQFNRWQSGPFFVDGRPKPLAAVFATPIYGWRTSRSATVWGQARPATSRIRVTLQRSTGGAFRDYKAVTTNAVGQFTAKVPRSSKTRYRFTFVDPSSQQTRTSDAVRLTKE